MIIKPAIEITPEMIEAGANVVCHLFYDVVPSPCDLAGRQLATQVYEAMARLDRGRGTGQ